MTALARELAVAALGAAGLVALGAAGLYVTTAPRWLSLLVEPLSLLLAPGLAAGLVLGYFRHEDPPYVVVAVVSYVFWWMALAAVLDWRARHRIQRRHPDHRPHAIDSTLP